MSRFDTYCAPPVSNLASSRRTTGVPNRGTAGHRNERVGPPTARYDRQVSRRREDGLFGGREVRPWGAAAIVVFLAAAAAGSGALRNGGEPGPKHEAWTMPALIAVVGLASLVGFATVAYAMWPSGLWKERKKRER